MKTKIYSVLLACAALPLFSQVGINTSTPTATLDVNGTLKVRDTPVAASVSGYQFPQDNTTTEVFKMDPQLLIAASSVNTTVFAAKKTSDLALLTITGPGGFKALNFVAADRTIGNGTLRIVMALYHTINRSICHWICIQVFNRVVAPLLLMAVLG
jgi:hypothetical protein